MLGGPDTRSKAALCSLSEAAAGGASSAALAGGEESFNFAPTFAEHSGADAAADGAVLVDEPRAPTGNMEGARVLQQRSGVNQELLHRAALTGELGKDAAGAGTEVASCPPLASGTGFLSRSRRASGTR